MAFAGDADYIRTRWATTPEAALSAEIDGRFVGSNLATRWGSVGFLTPVLSAPATSRPTSVGWSTYTSDPDQDRRLADCASLTDSVYPGLDVSRAIRACHEQRLGDTVVLDD
jgi:hypothetical protein